MATVEIVTPGPYRADTMTGKGQLMIKSQMLAAGDVVHFGLEYAEYLQSQQLAVILNVENIDLTPPPPAKKASPTPSPSPSPAKKKPTGKPPAAKKKAVTKKDAAAEAVKQPVAAARKPVTESRED